MKICLYKIPSSELLFLLDKLGKAYYWCPSSDHLLFWDRSWQSTDIQVGDQPLAILPKLSLDQPIILNGLLDDGFTPKVAHQMIDAHLQGVKQEWIIIWPKGDIPSDLTPFVEPKVWPLPTAETVAEILKKRNIYSERIVRACLGLHIGELERVLDTTEASVEETITNYKHRKLTASGIFHIPQPDCVAAGCENVIKIIETVGKLLSPEAEAAGLPFPRGMILMGPPGTGKSLTAKNAATHLGIPLICADWGGLISPEPGRTEENIRQLIAITEANAPSILFWDDFDKAFTSDDLSRENATEKRLAGFLLTWLQERQSKVFTIITCNRISQLPPELKRRFEWHIFVDLPHEGSRYEILRVHLKKYCGTIPNWERQAWKEVISSFNESTPDEIAKAVQKAAVAAFLCGNPGVITAGDLLREARSFMPANLASPDQIQAIRKQSRHGMTAASKDNSVYRIERVEEFNALLGNGGGA
jgi:hypothetical protein